MYSRVIEDAIVEDSDVLTRILNDLTQYGNQNDYHVHLNNDQKLRRKSICSMLDGHQGMFLEITLKFSQNR